MKLTKYEHACFTVEKDGKFLIVDPGKFTKDFVVPENVIAIVVTDGHGDHIDPELLATIFAKNPEATLVSLPVVIDSLSNFPSRAVAAGDTITIAPFNLEFFGGTHAMVHPSIPLVGNVGVLINEAIYYPGDSFSQPDKPVELLALPVSAPWLKLSETIDFLLAVKPKKVFPTHNALNSPIAEHMINSMLPKFAARVSSEYIPLQPEQSIELN